MCVLLVVQLPLVPLWQGPHQAVTCMTPGLTFFPLSSLPCRKFYAAAMTRHRIVFESSPYGFGSNILGLLLTMAAHNTSSQVFFDESTWKYECKGTPASGWKYLPGKVFSGHDNLKDHDPQKAFNRLRQCVQQLWQLSGHMTLKANAQAAYLRTLRKPLIGIVIRAGD